MISSNEFSARRQRMLSLMDENSLMIVFSGVEKKSSADEFFPFEVSRNFYYLTGIDQPDSSLVLVNSDGELKEFLFVSPFEPLKEKWYGKRLTPEEASSISGVSNVLINSTLEAKISAILDPSLALYGEIKKVYIDLDDELKIADDVFTTDYKTTLEAAHQGLVIEDAFALISTLRLRKSSAEIAELRSAISSTRLGIQHIMNQMHDGSKEYELADTFLHVINDDNGYQGLAFTTILAAGVNATCLHYRTLLGTAKEGDLLLMDLGARKNYYCADVSRTVPVSGKFSPLQRTIYEIVLGANKMVASIAKPGLTLRDLQKATVAYLAEGCLEKGLIKDKEEISNYYFHGVSHFIGLDTHDPYISVKSRACHDIPLEPGMVLSDEPGLYFAELGIGVRIEDDLLITEDGCEVLTKDIIKEVEDIEKYLATKK